MLMETNRLPMAHQRKLYYEMQPQKDKEEEKERDNLNVADLPMQEHANNLLYCHNHIGSNPLYATNGFAPPPLPTPVSASVAALHGTSINVMPTGTALPSHANPKETSYEQTNSKIQDAKKEMGSLLQQQALAKDEVERADEKVRQAVEALEKTKEEKSKLDVYFQDRVEALTEVLLQDETSTWNGVYKKLKKYYEERKKQQLPEERGTHLVGGKPLLFIEPELKKNKDRNHELRMLDTWMSKQRSAKRKSEASGEVLERYQIHALNQLGFEWEPRESQWNTRFEELRAYMQKHGRQPTKGQRCKGKPHEKDALGIWCSGQVIEYNRMMEMKEGKIAKEGKTSYMTEKKIELLESIGFVWDKKSHSWDKNYGTVKEYYLERGDCKVPKTYHDKTLYNWVIKQRKYYRKFEKKIDCPLTKEQFEKLKSIDFMKDLPKL